MSNDRLTFRRKLRDGRILALNVWPTGYQELVYPSLKSFEEAKRQVEQEGRVPETHGFTPA